MVGNILLNFSETLVMDPIEIALTVIRFGFPLLLLCLHTGVMVGMLRMWLQDHQLCRAAQACTASPEEPLVSVIIPIHNEAARISGLLETLAQQDYPHTEYIFVDDRSTDSSAEMILAFAEQECAKVGAADGEGSWISRKVLLISLTENPGPNFKQYALSRGIEAASGDLLLLTDGDCQASPGWVGAMKMRMEDPRMGIAIGPVFRQREGKGFFHRFQCFDHAIRYSYLSGCVGMGWPFGGFGNNLIINRHALDTLGGYAKVPSSPTEDAALISIFRKSGEYRLHSASRQDTWVFTHGEAGWKALINQTLRWNNGGLYSPDVFTRVNFRYLMISITVGFFALPFIVLIPELWPLSASVYIVVSAVTGGTLKLFKPALPAKKPPFSYFFYAGFLPPFFTLLTILGFCGVKTEWKGAKLKFLNQRYKSPRPS